MKNYRPTAFTRCLYLVICLITSYYSLWPSVLWRCWLGGRSGIRPVKTEWWGAGVVICLERGADLHTVQLMPLPLNVSCFSKIQIGFAFLVPAYPASPGQRAVKRVCVCTRYSIWSHVYACRPIRSFCSCVSSFYVFFACLRYVLCAPIDCAAVFYEWDCIIHWLIVLYWSIQLYSCKSA